MVLHYIQIWNITFWEDGMTMYTIFSVIIGGRVAFFDFYNGIMNLLE